MKIYIDESGDFNVKDRNNVSVLASVVVPENKEYKLEKLFEKLSKKVTKEEKDETGEIKGYLLKPENIKFVFMFLSRNIDFRITSVIFDHSITKTKDVAEHRIGQAQRFQMGKDYYLTGPVKAKAVLDFFDEKKRWVERSDLISDVLYIQLSLQVQVISETFKKMLVHYYDDVYRRLCFDNFTFIIDRKNKKIKKPEKYISQLIFGFLETQWSGRKPYATISNLGENGHPFTKFDKEVNGRVGTDLKKLFGDGLQFGDSKNYVGLRLVDIIANGIRRIALERLEKEVFDLIRKNSAFFEEKWRPVSLATFCLSGKRKTGNRSKLYGYLQRKPKNLPL